jgi:hypothetical protein
VIDAAHASILSPDFEWAGARDLRETGRAGGLLLVAEPALLGEHDERGLGRVADDRPAGVRVEETRAVAAGEPLRNACPHGIECWPWWACA